MTMLDENIRRFRTMTEADPENELGHFSLGKALLEAGRPDEAVESLERVIRINRMFSKAYELLAAAQLGCNQQVAAIGTLKSGYAIAVERGDVQVEKMLVRMLTELGQAPPAVARRAAASPSGGGADESGFSCKRCGATTGKLPNRPFKGQLGEQIGATICQQCWREWVAMGTKVINELGLQMANPQSQEIYDQYMREFLML